MVTIQRNHIRKGKSIFGTHLPLGNDDSNASSLSQVGSPKWTFKVIWFVVLLSWVAAFRTDGKLRSTFYSFQTKMKALSMQSAHTLDLIKDAKRKRDAILRQNRQQQRTKRLFDHEARMSEELYEMKETGSSSEVEKLIEQRQNGITSSWVQQRQDALYQKIVNLQLNAKEQCRKRAIEKYGPGPHHIQFDVLTGQNARTPGSFVVELAPLDLVPYSVSVFLDMATHQLWDNTVFYHHSSQHHVIAAAPVNFGTFDPKGHHFDALGLNKLAFPDYSSNYPHSQVCKWRRKPCNMFLITNITMLTWSSNLQYTLGFSGLGPNFFISTIDNRNHHGPGGQVHHEISADADPCFGKIISGHHVLQRMMPDRSASSNPSTWEDYDLTRIVSVRVIGVDL